MGISGKSVPRYLCPIPEQVRWKDGEYEFGAEVLCSIDPSLAEGELKEGLKGELGRGLTGTIKDLWGKFTLGIGKIELIPFSDLAASCVVIKKSVDLAEEGYELRVNDRGIEIRVSSVRGFLHAWYTLVQLIYPRSLEPGPEKFAIPRVEIADKPALKFRGLHLCVFPETTLTFLEKSIRMAGLMKFSHIVLEFWGTLQSDVMAEFAWPDHSYTKGEVQPLIDIAHDMGMEVIPMLNCLGHASGSRALYGRHVVLDQNPRKALLFEPDGWTWCLSNPETRELLKAARRELIELCGEGRYFHLGFDEAYSYATCDRCRQKDGTAMFAEYLNEVTEELGQIGRRPIIWGDALLDQTKWKYPNIATSRPDQRTHEALDQMDKRILIADWQYNVTEGKVPTSKYFMQKGFDTLLCSYNNNQNISTLGKEAQKTEAFGLLATTWHTLPEHITLIPCAAEAAWSKEKEGRPFTSKGGNIQTLAANLQRKLVPVNGIYEAAGWRRKEVDI
ncbi:family 20 glycosylhydrolase [Eubacteriales bacterium mix99]